MGRTIARITAGMALLVAIGLVFTWWAVQQTRHVPEFYARATKSIPRQRHQEQSRQLESEVQRLQAEAARAGRWRATFSDDHINGWLAAELPNKFPQLLAKGASEPRICIEDGRLLAAVRYKDRRFDMVISCALAVELTEQPNMLALRVERLKAGALPLPLGKFVGGISKEAAKGDIDIRWDKTESGPIALVTIPSEHPQYVTNPVIIESVELVDGGLVLSGHSGPLAWRQYNPQGKVYRFVSYRPTEKHNVQPARLSSKRDEASTTLR